MSAPADLVPFAAFASEMPGATRRIIERASARGDFVPGVRLTPRAPMLFRRDAVMAWLESRLSVLNEADQ